MLKNAHVAVSFSVDDLKKAVQFYRETLGVEVDDTSSPGMALLNLANNNQVMVYAKPNHKPAVYTLLNFMVDDLDKEMKVLKAKGVEFLQYDEPNCKTDKHGVVDYGVMRIAFFEDPAGNNHAVAEMKKS
jgi:catechol 2,3-dioxygenase-like lactoylglutathione lyase family enzyme